MDDGRLIAEALITRPGVFRYLDPKYPGGWRLELRPDEEVYSRETMDSFANVPCTSGHPPQLLDATTAKTYMVGSTGDRVSRVPVPGQPDWLKTTVMIADGATVKRMDDGNNATSSGYKCIIEDKAGVDPKYGPYHVIQRKIRGNHQAVAIPLGRAGEIARVRMDDIATYEQLAASSLMAPVEEQSFIVLTSTTDGHQHTLDPSDPSGCTSGAISEGADGTHRHEWVRAADGSITIGANAGHTHTVDSSTLGVRADRMDQVGGGRRSVGVTAAVKPEPVRTTLGGIMDPEKLLESVRTLEAGLKKAESEKAAETARADSAIVERDAERGKVTQLEKEAESLRVQIAAGRTAVETEAVTREKARADAAEEKVSRFDETVHNMVRARCKVMHEAALVLGTEFRMDDLSDRAIRAAVVQRLDSTADVSASVPDGVIVGMYDQLLKRRLARAREDARVADIIGTSNNQIRTDAATDKAAKRDAYRNQAKRPLSELIGRKGE
jgi:hypothetical protein